MTSATHPITSIAIGSFDGLHVAHRTLIDQAEGVVVIERDSGYLTPGYKRSWYTDKPLYFYPFEKIRGWSAAEFVVQLQRDFPALERIVVGYDFGFGQGREGDAVYLRGLFGGEVVIVGEVQVEGISVHSRTIRAYLRAGDVILVNRLLGRPYAIDGEVIPGQGIGGRKLVPTLNLAVRDYQLPAEGVYVTQTRIGEVWLPSVSFVGHRESTDGTFAVETHVIDREIGKCTGRIGIRWIEKMRDNRRFEDLEELKRQIDADIAQARRREHG